MKQAIIFVNGHYKDRSNRIIILSDCKFAINAIYNKFSAECYSSGIRECQNILISLGSENIPEIYWIKGHTGIPGNDRVDTVAKRARYSAQLKQPDLYQRPNKSASFLNYHGLNPFFTAQWNRHWTNHGDVNNRHKHPKQFLPNLIEAQSFERMILHQLSMNERRIICRLITGKVALNKYLHSINRSISPECKWCIGENETVKHFILKCKHYESQRIE